MSPAVSLVQLPAADGVLLASRLALAVVLVAAAVAKLADREGARRSLGGFGVPAGVVPALALGLPLAELLLAAGLIASSTAWVAAVGATILLAAFTLAVGRALARGTESDCHCFGRLSAEPIGPRLLARNGVLLALAGLVAVTGRDDAGTSATAWLSEVPTGTAVAVVVGAVLGAGLAVNFAFLLGLLRQNGRLWAELEELRTAGAGPPQELAVGKPVPRFELPDLSGARVALEDLFDGERELMLVFVHPECSACDALLPAIAAGQRDPGTDPMPVLVSQGRPEDARAKLADHELDRVLLAGEDLALARSLGVSGMPGAVVLDRAGRVAGEPVLGALRVGALLATARPAPALALVEVGG